MRLGHSFPVIIACISSLIFAKDAKTKRIEADRNLIEPQNNSTVQQACVLEKGLFIGEWKVSLDSRPPEEPPEESREHFHYDPLAQSLT